jgi:hypothetical protein
MEDTKYKFRSKMRESKNGDSPTTTIRASAREKSTSKKRIPQVYERIFGIRSHGSL